MNKVNRGIQRLIERHDELNRKFAPLRGQRFTALDGTVWEYSSCNDISIGYFKRVVDGKTQKAEFTVSGFDRDWLEEKLGEVE